jgi:hypothetical protein
MRIDVYTKTILTLIALLLAVIALRPLIQPQSKALAAGKFSDVQFTLSFGGLYAVDTRNGDIWHYGMGGDAGNVVERLGRIDELGKPLAK